MNWLSFFLGVFAAYAVSAALTAVLLLSARREAKRAALAESTTRVLRVALKGDR